MSSTMTWMGGRMIRLTREGAARALSRSAAYVRGVARRKIRYSKNKVSQPGQPPYQHIKGGNGFKNSIMFAVDADNLAAYVGPRIMPGIRNEQNQPAPQVLEHGGMSPAGAGRWMYRSKALANVRTLDGIMAYFASVGYGPLFMENSFAGVRRQASHGRKYAGRTIHRLRTKDLTGKTVYYLGVKMRTPRQIRKAAQNAVRFYGFPGIKQTRVAPRPFMGPALDASLSYLGNSLKSILK